MGSRFLHYLRRLHLFTTLVGLYFGSTSEMTFGTFFRVTFVLTALVWVGTQDEFTEPIVFAGFFIVRFLIFTGKNFFPMMISLFTAARKFIIAALWRLWFLLVWYTMGDWQDDHVWLGWWKLLENELLHKYLIGESWLSTACEEIIEHNRFRHLFTASVMIYAYFYDRFNHNFISHVYAQDKYGVVIVYGIVALLKLYIEQKRLELDPSMVWNMLGARKRHLFNITLTLFTLLKMLAFALIFKNHTSHENEHQAVHLAMVILLGVVSLPSLAFIIAIRQAHQGANELRKFICYSICFGIIFQCIADLQKGTRLGNYRIYTSNPPPCTLEQCIANALVTFFEALMIVQTI